MKSLTDITIVLDSSSSMKKIQAATIEGINAFIADQQKVPGDGVWTLVTFDDPIYAQQNLEDFPKIVYEAVDQRFVPELTSETFKPRGNTALIDALCKIIDRTGKRLALLPESERPDKVLFVIMTDGEENFSKEFTRKQLAEKTAHQEAKYKWRFIYLGANQDSFANASNYGMNLRSTSNFTYTQDGTKGILEKMSRATRDWKLDGNNSAAPFLGSSDPDPQDVTVTVKVKN